MHVDPPKDLPIECVMDLASSLRAGTVFDTPRQSFLHVWNILGWGGGTFLPESVAPGSATALAASATADSLTDTEKSELQALKSAIDSASLPPADAEGGPLSDFFASILPLLLAKLQEWLGGLLG